MGLYLIIVCFASSVNLRQCLDASEGFKLKSEIALVYIR
jgi:hypothetical protein